MIQEITKLNVADNTGATCVGCIKVLSHSKKRYAYVGDLIKVSVKSILPESSHSGKVKKKGIYLAVVVRTKSLILRENNCSIKFSDNAVVLLGEDFKPLGTRIFGPIPRELRHPKYGGLYKKILSLSMEVV